MSEPLVVLFDFADPYSYLALEPLTGLAQESALPCHWYPFLTRRLQSPVEPGPDGDRGAWHRWWRARYQERDLCRYADARGLAARHFHDGGLYRESTGEVAALGFNWAAGAGPSAAQEFLHETFAGYWDGALDLDCVDEIGGVLERCQLESDGFDDYCLGAGLEELAAQRASLVEEGVFSAPAVLLDGEVFLGRQHLPYLRYRLKQRASGTPQ
jgi:2-hydroxychromene-2-carboxylate isomerase